MIVDANMGALHDTLTIIADGNTELVNQAIRLAALRGLVQRGEHVATVEDVVSYIVAVRDHAAIV